jgi:hypothetical protein
MFSLLCDPTKPPEVIINNNCECEWLKKYSRKRAKKKKVERRRVNVARDYNLIDVRCLRTEFGLRSEREEDWLRGSERRTKVVRVVTGSRNRKNGKSVRCSSWLNSLKSIEFVRVQVQLKVMHEVDLVLSFLID